ncbi:MAG: PaaI family thioesterase [Candidatus Methanomethylophilaceae archaeon]|nr:PaaI family thioesterase [Candidatus Methanomethylophilaceae archaeon]
MTFESLEQARELFKNDRFATKNGAYITEVSDKRCVCCMDITDDHRNALGGIMGGAIFALADFAFAVASNNDHSPTVALDVNIHYLGSSKGSRLTATSELVKSGRTTSVFNIRVTDDQGKDVALFIGTGYKL